MDTLFALKEKLTTVGAELEKVSAELMNKAADAAVPIDEVTALETKQANLQKRYNLIKAEHDRLEAEQKAKIKRDQQKNGVANAKNDAERIVAAKATFYRASILRQPMPEDVLEVLGSARPLQALPAGDGTGGEHFLPTNLSTELITEPFTENPLRGSIGMSNVKGLELPRIAFELYGAGGFQVDDNTAHEINATGDKVSFSRNKFKVKVRISDTVLHGSDIELVSYVENALRSGLAAKEKSTAFAEHDGDSDVNYMSFYAEDSSEDTLIKSVEGADLFEAITNAIADLHENYRENAKVCMKFADYVTMLKTLSNNSATLYGAPPEQIIGKPVIFSDSADVPIVGNFRYYHLNYDGVPIFDSDKNVDKGEYIWVLTGWFDQRFKLRTAFRLAEVVAESE